MSPEDFLLLPGIRIVYISPRGATSQPVQPSADLRHVDVRLVHKNLWIIVEWQFFLLHLEPEGHDTAKQTTHISFLSAMEKACEWNPGYSLDKFDFSENFLFWTIWIKSTCCIVLIFLKCQWQKGSALRLCNGNPHPPDTIGVLHFCLSFFPCSSSQPWHRFNSDNYGTFTSHSEHVFRFLTWAKILIQGWRRPRPATEP